MLNSIHRGVKKYYKIGWEKLVTGMSDPDYRFWGSLISNYNQVIGFIKL
jgi:hypothetical protein